MPGRDDYFGRNSEYEAYERNRRELEDRGGRGRMSEERSFGRSGQQGRWSEDRERLGDYEGHTGEAEGWRSERAGSRYDQERTHYSRGGRPDWQDRDWQGGSPGLSHGYEDDERRMRERHERDFDQRRPGGLAQDRSRSFRQGRSDEFGYGGQEYGIEAGRSEFGRSPEPVQRVTDAEDDRNWRDRFGDDGRPHPSFGEDDRERRFGGREEHQRRQDENRGMFGGRDERGSWFGRHDEDRERRFGGRDEGHMRWRDQGGTYGDTHMDREDRGMAEYGVPHDYGYRESVDPFEAADSRRRQEEIRRRADEDRRRRADLERQEDEYRATQRRTSWDRNW
jgi:hypothetical protein